MQVDTFGAGESLVWVMGWGNVADSRHERWLIDQFVDAGYRTHVLELPTNDPDFAGEYVGPVRAYIDDLEDPVLVAHSMGGLTVAHVRPEQPVVYLSPWWGMDESDLPAVAHVLLELPTARQFIPNSGDPSALGELATDADDTGPDRISPRWLSAMRQAHETLPPIKGSDVVFYTKTDEVVDPDAIEAHASEEQRRVYEGGHELFASRRREEYIGDVLVELDAMG